MNTEFTPLLATHIGAALTFEQLKPGKLYRITEHGNADPQFMGALVLGVPVRMGYRGVTIETPSCADPCWLGAPWGKTDGNDDDEDTRFVEVSNRADKPIVVVDLAGGCISNVRADRPCRVILLDDDTEGGDPDSIQNVDGLERYVSDWNLAEGAGVDAAECEHIVRELGPGLYEVTAAGFYGGTDETDDRVLWVHAPNRATLEAWTEGTGATVCGEVPGPDPVDFVLPRDFDAYRAKLLAFKEDAAPFCQHCDVKNAPGALRCIACAESMTA